MMDSRLVLPLPEGPMQREQLAGQTATGDAVQNLHTPEEVGSAFR